VQLLANYTVLTNWNLIGNSYVPPVGLSITSSDTNVLTVNGGQIQGVGLGSATVTVTYQGTTNSQAVNVVRAPTAVLTHRYSFNDPAGSTTAADSVGGLDGTFQGAAFETNGQLVVPNAEVAGVVIAPATDYLQLPDGIITNAVNGIGTNYTDPSVTVEAWATIYPNQYTWANLFDFGNQDSSGDAAYDIHVCVHGGDGDAIIGISDSDNANADYQDEDVPGTGGSKLDGSTNIHVVAVFNPPAGYLAIYTNGVLMGENPNITISMAGVWAALNKVGADNWPDPGLQGSVDELRIYNGVLEPDDVMKTQALGPNQLLTPGLSLGAAVSSGNLQISWPVSGSTGFSLYSSSTLGPSAVWTLVNVTPTVVGQNNQVSLPISSGVQAQFYKLQN
jgi:hypothetical protein